MRVDEPFPDLAGGHAAFFHLRPGREVSGHFLPELPGELGIFVEVPSGETFDEVGTGIIEGGEGEKLAGSRSERRFLHVHDLLEELGFQDDELGELGLVVAVIVEESDGAAGADRVAVEVGKHLLAALQADIEEKYDGNGLVGEFRPLFERGDDGGPAVLAVVDDELGIHRDLEDAELVLCAERFEIDVGIDGDSESGENVIVRIIEDVTRDFRNPAFVENPLGTEFGWEFVLVENGDLAHHAQAPHGHVVFSPCLESTDDGKAEGWFGVHRIWEVQGRE